MQAAPFRLAAALAATTLAVTAAPARPPATVDVGIVAINDFHGNLLPPKQAVVAPADPAHPEGPTVEVPAGGAAWLASAIDTIHARHPHHITVSAGDLVSSAPTLDTLFLDEPTIGVMNRIGLDLNAVGNHEFDRGPGELLRLARGGCQRFGPRQPCQVERFAGARFPFLAANTLTAEGKPLFPPIALRSFGRGKARVRIGFVGVTTVNTADLVSPGTRGGLHWTDEADTINRAVPRLKAMGADAVVVLIHQGGRTDSTHPDPNGCADFHGDARDDIRPILARLDPRVDVVVSGHTHWAYVCSWPSRDPAKKFLVTSAGLWGKLVTDIALRIDPRRHRVVSAEARNVIVQSPGYQAARGAVVNTDAYPRFAPRGDIAAYVEHYRQAGEAVLGKRVGWLAGPAEKTSGTAFNTGGALGALIADGELAATRSVGAQVAFINPFGVRVSLVPAADHGVTYGQVVAVQPFANPLVTMTLTGAELKAALEQGFDANGPEQVLTPSAGFGYVYDRSRAEGDRVTTMTLGGKPVDPAASLRVTVPKFLAEGGDTFAAFAKGRDRVEGPIDADALAAWLVPLPPRALPMEPRAVDARPDLNRVNNTPPPGQHY